MYEMDVGKQTWRRHVDQLLNMQPNSTPELPASNQQDSTPESLLDPPLSPLPYKL